MGCTPSSLIQIHRYSRYNVLRNNILKNGVLKNNVSKQGRWIIKNNKQVDISSYWSNIDHCGDKVCGNLKETKSFYEKEVLKINNKIEKHLNNKKF